MSRERRQMQKVLTAAKTERKCSVAGCRSVNLSVHHIVPVSLLGNVPENLVYLCSDHHALVERYYFWMRTRLAPALCRELVSIARAFDTASVPPLLVSTLRVRSQAIWRELNQLPESCNPSWWQRVYAQALEWAQHQTIVRTVVSSRAIIESPWFRDVRTEAKTA